MKEIESKNLGKISIEEKQVITFQDGLPGFENMKEFALVDSGQEPFYLLQSVENPDIAFILIDPFLICHDYEIEIPDEEMNALGLKGEKHSALIFAIISIRENGALITANLQAPIIINGESKLGVQYIVNDSKWSIRHVIGSEGAKC